MSNTIRHIVLFIALAAAIVLICSTPADAAISGDAVRVKDLGKVSGWRENALVGYGLVTGLAGTGDSSRNRATRQSLANMLSRFNLTLSGDDLQSRNTAAVMVTSVLSPFAKPGDALDVTVTSIGDARSLVGGLLVMAPLSGADGRVYALAQGPVLVGGYKYDLNGNVMQKNHPTTGTVANGATVETAVEGPAEGSQVSRLTFALAEADFTTATRVAAAIDTELGAPLARARDASAIDVQVPENQRDRLSEFVARLENVKVAPDLKARVVINERTGTVVAGGDVRISKVVISQGDLKISVVTTNQVSQPLLVARTGPDVRTQPYANTTISVEEGSDSAAITASNTVTDLVQALHRLKTSTRDVISILRAMKSAGALHADLVVQ
jgi:flagellar P-ring protein precursor FlgI